MPLKKSFPAFLVSLMVLALAYPVLAYLAIAGTPVRPTMLYLLGEPGYRVIYRIMSIPFRLGLPEAQGAPWSLSLNLIYYWILAALVMAVPAAVSGSIALDRLNRRGGGEPWRFALAGAIWMPLPWLAILLVRVLALGDFIDFLTALIAGVPMLYFWLAPFGAGQGLVYAAMAGGASPDIPPDMPEISPPPPVSHPPPPPAPGRTTKPQTGFGRRSSSPGR